MDSWQGAAVMISRLSLCMGALIVLGCSSAPRGTPSPDGGEADSGGDDGGPVGPITPCTVTSKGSAGSVLVGHVLAPSGPIDGEVFIDGTGLIACVAPSCAQTAGYALATVISCKGSVISPGIVNAHEHMDYVQAPNPASTTRYLHRNDWRTGANGAPKYTPAPKASTDANLLAGAELRHVMSGTTALLSSGGVSGLVRNVASFKNPQWLEGLTGKPAFFDTFPLGDSNGVELASGCGYPNIRSAGAAFADGTYTPHIAEGINTAAENEFTCLQSTLVTNRTAVIHGVGLNATDVSVIQKSGAMLIWSPRSNTDLYGNTASVTVFKELGVPIALGTDWLPSGSMNMLHELACASALNDKYFGHAFTSRDLWTMATKNGALAAGFPAQIGELTPNAQGDIAVFDGQSGADYDAVVKASPEDVHLVMRGGKVLYADAEIAKALGTGCVDLDVCGEKRQACIDTPMTTLASIRAATEGVYPLFFCRDQVTTHEPTCTPYRDGYPNGSSATDRDGDGVLDAQDDCADVFNPARPMDSGKQSDVDTDGFGDACDRAPTDSSTH